MHVLVTAGGTAERIDSVRAITNFSTGKLGSLVVEEFSKVPNVEITYICTKQAIRPNIKTIRTIEIESVQELLEAIEKELKNTQYDCVVHSMAVSDYYLVGSASEEKIINKIAESYQENDEYLKNSIQQGLNEAFILEKDGPKKMSSDIETLYFQLKQTPKVISYIKKLQPKTRLVGFKLLVDVCEGELIEVGKGLMKKNDCDYVLANDMNQINGTQHIGYLVADDGSYQQFKTKQEIAKGIVGQVMEDRK